MEFNVDELNEIIDMDTVLKRVNGNVKLLYKLLGIMRERYENSYQDIINLINNDNIEEAISIVHTIKGAAGNLSITELYISALNLEDGLKEKSHNTEQLLEAFKESIEKTLKII